ncbi:MAG: protein-L-isoaspartate(D-aspartate) O-methyltransferase [Burkholderiaceae bacterium]|jgi:protein-L-isoaspartate(D-aspartate) O-methyltransferase
MNNERKPPLPLMPQNVRHRDAVPVAFGGLGLTSDRARERMLERLSKAGIGYAAVLDAMRQVPRHLFVDEALASRAYEDAALPIGYQQTISRPFIVARVAEYILENGRPLKKVLEVGAGCGYQAAVLARLSPVVLSIERIRALFDKARLNLRSSGATGVKLLYGDGLAGQVSEAPFDAIVVAAAGLQVPPALLEQLAIGGRLVVPVADGNRQVLAVVDRTGDQKWQRQDRDAVRFVPLLPGTRTF